MLVYPGVFINDEHSLTTILVASDFQDFFSHSYPANAPAVVF